MSKTILIVEDHQDSRELLADALRFAGYKVVEAGDGEEGERIAIELAPDALVLDISLPGKSGWEVIASLKAHAPTAGTPVIALTAHARAQDEQRALDAGCSRYLPKPVKPKQVIQTLETLIGTSDA